MHIDRIQIEEGFLDGLDLSFSAGLNVIIGARGTGKTSLIELLRYALGVSSFTPEAAARSEAHAKAILTSGQVVASITNQDDHHVTVTRSASEDRARSTGPYSRPLILSQTEVETLGVHAGGRLRLLDGFRSEQTKASKGSEESLVSEISSLTLQIMDGFREIEELEQQVRTLPEILQELETLKPAELLVSQASVDAAERSKELAALIDTTSKLGVSLAQYERFLAANQRRQADLRAVMQRWGSDEPAGDGDKELRNAIAFSESAKKHIAGALDDLSRAQEIIETRKRTVGAERVTAESNSRLLRQQIETIQAGAGQTARRVQQLRERAAQLSSLSSLLAERRKSTAAVVARRAAALDRLEELRDSRFQLRRETAERLNERLGPRIRVEVERSGQSEGYATAIAAALKGSGIRYNELSQIIAKAVSPRELLEWAENNDVTALMEAARIPRDRAVRTLAALRDADLAEIGSYLVEDDVQFFLLDGTDHKPITDLSMGQRCTVVLPIVLERRDNTIVVDQPEDHIDNAFITETLIKAMSDRAREGQIIVSTHNANIPVLGNASQVIQMGSDGRRGFVLVNAPLDDDEVVHAITSVMEGGKEAFHRRADFYEQYE